MGGNTLEVYRVLLFWLGFPDPISPQSWVGSSRSLVLTELPPSLGVQGWGPSQALTNPANKVTFCAWGRRSGKSQQQFEEGYGLGICTRVGHREGER